MHIACIDIDCHILTIHIFHIPFLSFILINIMHLSPFMPYIHTSMSTLHSYVFICLPLMHAIHMLYNQAFQTSMSTYAAHTISFP